MDADYSVITQNCGYYNIKNPLKEFTSVKPMFASWELDASKYTSGILYKACSQCTSRRSKHGLCHLLFYKIKEV